MSSQPFGSEISPGSSLSVREPRTAPVWARFLALLADGVVWMPIALGVAYVASRKPGLGIFLFPAGLISYVVYQVCFHALFGATLGKMLLRIRVVRTDLSPVDFNAALRRSFVDAVFRLGLAIVSVRILQSLGPLPINSVLTFVKTLQTNTSYVALSNLDGMWTISEIVTCLFNPQRRAIHDLIGGTRVVKREKN